jgi:hypothetical protein
MEFVQLVIAVFVALAVLVYVRFRRTSRPPLPPGPPGEPFLGHLRIAPASNPERAYHNWSREFNSEIHSLLPLSTSQFELPSHRRRYPL